MRDCTTRTPLNLELQTPLLRPEAFPWGSANVEVHAICTSQACRRVISLPGVMDLAQRDLGTHSQPAESLGIEIVGFDNGVTFALGKASIPLPATLQPTAISDSQFRVCLTGEEGVRNGTLVGRIQARSPTGDDPEAGEALGTRGSQTHPGSARGECRKKIAGETADVRGADNGMDARQASKVNPRKSRLTIRVRTKYVLLVRALVIK